MNPRSRLADVFWSLAILALMCVSMFFLFKCCSHDFSVQPMSIFIIYIYTYTEFASISKNLKTIHELNVDLCLAIQCDLFFAT